MTIYPLEMAKRDNFYRVAALQMMTFAARGFTLPFINLYLVSVGFTGTQIGLLVSVSALVQLLLTPALNTWADRRQRHRGLYRSLLGSNAAATAGLILSTNPLWLAGTVIARDSSDLPAATLLSQLTITWLGEKQRGLFGRIRAWGSFGWAVTTLISGRIFALGGYPLLFLLTAVINLLIIPFAKVLPEHTLHRHKSEHTPRQARFYILMASLFLYYVGFTAFNNFNYIYFKQALGASNEMIGVIVSLSAVAEIPVMLNIDRLLRRTSTLTTLMIGFVGLSGLWLLITLLPDSRLLIPIMMVRGLFFTMQNVSMTLLVAQISSPRNVATNQAIAQVTMLGLTVLLTGPITGWLFDHAGGQVLFQIAALMPLFASILLLATRRQFVTSPRPPSALE
jgi:PPP family 3-phenylpropionic acid transporter